MEGRIEGSKFFIEEEKIKIQYIRWLDLVAESVVIASKCDSYNVDLLYKNISHAISLLERTSKKLRKQHKKIVIKINLCDARPPETGAITHPLFLDALLMYLRKKYGKNVEIFIVESEGTVAAPDLFVKWFGFEKIFEKWNVKYVNLTNVKSKYITLNGKIFRKIPIPEPLLDMDLFISLAKLKTNILTKITACLKNLFGCLPTPKKGVYHPVIEQTIAEVAKAFKPDMCIIDGIIGMGGVKGPAFGIPIKSKIIIYSTDPVAADSFASTFMGFNPWSVKHIVLSFKEGVGNMNYKLYSLNFEKFTIEKYIAYYGRLYKINPVDEFLFRFASKVQTIARRKMRH